MSLDLWSRAKPVFGQALQRPAADRAAFLAEACADDSDLRAEVERLLALAEGADQFFGTLLDDLWDDGPDGVPLPERVGPWRVVRELGRGGMGRVLLAERDDGAFEQRVAVKLVESGAPGLVRRFQRERRILASLEHPGIARLYDGGALPDGRPYLVMEYVAGEPITAYADARSLSVRDRLRLFAQVCDAVAYAHRNLVVHRDLKPSNILVAADAAGRPHVTLLDFGIARLLDQEADGALTLTAQRVYSPVYAAPEQIRGEAVSTTTDVYALGVLLYELLTGQRPFGGAGTSRWAAETATLHEAPVAPSAVVGKDGGGARRRRRLRGDLDRIVLTAMRKEPERRYPSAEALARDVERHLAHLPIEARAPTLRYRAHRFARRHRTGVGLGALAVVVLTLGLAWRGALLAYDRYQVYPFADRAAFYDHGGTVTYAPAADPSSALQMPGHRSRLGGAMVSLGVGGALVLEFTDNVLMDGPGADLIIWEGGAAVERVDVAVSVDGGAYLPLGRTEDRNHAFDLAALGRPGAEYRFVRLVDVVEPDESLVPRRSAGADIDAIMAANGRLDPPRPVLEAVAAVGRTLRSLTGDEMRAGEELVGGDFEGADVAAGGAPVCRARCRAEPVCRSWTFISAEEAGLGHCRLKALVPRPVFCAYCTSGIVRP